MARAETMQAVKRKRSRRRGRVACGCRSCGVKGASRRGDVALVCELQERRRREEREEKEREWRGREMEKGREREEKGCV
jgi:hypothetical protein